MTHLWTAACDSLVAVLHNASIGHGRLTIPLYSAMNGELQSTLACSLPFQDNHHDDNVVKLLFASPDHVCVWMHPNTVVVWNVTRGVVVHTLTLKSTVYDVVQDDDSSLYVLTRKQKKLYIYQYSLQSGCLVRKLKCGMHVSDDITDTTASLAVSNEYLVIGKDAQVRVLSLENASKVAKLKVSKDNNVLLCLQEGRLAVVTLTEILLYNVVELSDKPVGRIFVQHAVDSIDMQDDILMVHTEATVLLYKWPTNAQEEPLKPMTTIVFDNDVHVARLVFAASDLVAVVYSTVKGIHVQRVAFRNNAEDTVLEKVVIGFPSEQASSVNDTATTKRSTPSTTTTLGPGQAGGEALQVSDRPIKKAKTNATEMEDLSIAERLQQLTQEMMNQDEPEEEEESPKQISQKATTESLSNLLNQALSSGDDSMLELCLSIRDKKVITTSLQDLSEDLVSLLLTKLTWRLSHKPNRAAELSVWISLVLQSGKVRSTQHLRPLRNLLQERVDSFPHLLQLEGRLSILAAMK